MKKLTVKSQLLILSFFMLAVQFVIGGLSYNSLHKISDSLHSVFVTRLPSINYLVQADRDFQQMMVAERTLLMEGLTEETREKILKDYIANKKQVVDRFKMYEALATTEEEKALVKAFYQAHEKWQTMSESNMVNGEGRNLVNSFNKEVLSGLSLGELSKHFEESRDKMDKLQELILGFGNAEYESAKASYSNATLTIIGISLAGMVLSLFLGYTISQGINFKITSIVKSISNEGHNLEGMSSHLDSKSNEMKSVSGELSTATTETTASIHEITQMIRNNTEGANKVTSLISNGKAMLGAGVHNLEELTNKIKMLEASSGELSQIVDHSNKELSEIISVFNEVNEKTKVINEIVFQTKLLSFNASVEAARAGEQGKGFAVVAEEVGNLAKMSGDSAAQISSLLDSSLKKVTDIIESSKQKINNSMEVNKSYVEESVKLSTDCKETIIKVSNDFEEVSQTSNEVSIASKEQLSGVEEVNRAMNSITTAASSTSSSAESANEAARNMRESVENISYIIEDLKSLVYRKSSAFDVYQEAEIITPIETFEEDSTDKVA